MHRLVVVGRWNGVAANVPPLQTRQVRNFQNSLKSDGVRKVVGHGALRHDCPVSPSVGAGKDCFVYHLQGQQVIPANGVVVLNARLHLWVDYVDGHWQLANYQYDLLPSG